MDCEVVQRLKEHAIRASSRARFDLAPLVMDKPQSGVHSRGELAYALHRAVSRGVRRSGVPSMRSSHG